MLTRHCRTHPTIQRPWQADDSSGIRIGYLSSYPPRECGIATFCEDLLTATRASREAGEPIVVAMTGSSSVAARYEDPVRLVVNEEDESEYEAAAELFNDSAVDLVSIQHEFGVFGGDNGQGLHRLLDRLVKPAITTFHTVLPDPPASQRATLRRLAACSERVVVMNSLARDILWSDYGIEESKVALIHHGAPAPSQEEREAAKASLGLASRKVLSTFGFVSPGKGLEYALWALPAIRRRHPDVCYLIIGKTHPQVQRAERESYREKLIRILQHLNLQDTVRFVNSYQPRESIIRHLTATDIYLTPYLNPHQITSGTLAYAMAAGKAIVSTPYLYARFLLADGRGRLVPFRRPEAIAGAVTDVLSRRDLQQELEARTRAYGRQLSWPAVGRRFVDLCQQVLGRQPVLARAAADRAREWLVPTGRERGDRDDDRGREVHLPGSFAATN